MNWRRVVITLAIACIAGPLLLHLFASTSRTVELDADGPLTLFRDVGRGFYPADAVSLEGPGPFTVRVPISTRGLKVEPSASVRSVRLDGDEITPGPLSPPPPPSFTMLAIVGVIAILLGLFLGPRLRPLTVERLFTVEGFVISAVWWALSILALERTAEFVDAWVVRFDNPPWWPISIVDPVQPGWLAIIAAFALVALVAWASRRFIERPVALAAVLSIAALGTNSLHGWTQGLETPSSGSQSYWLDVNANESAGDFLLHFNERQRALHTHSRTHPPLAVLLYAPFVHLGSGVLASLVLGALAFCGSLWSLSRLHRSPMPLFVALPAVQIYFFASLDAVICAVFFVTLMLAMSEDSRARWWSALPLFVATQLTFAALFLVALLGWQAITKRSRELFGVLAIVALAIVALRPLFGFDWWEALRVASALENPGGFRLLHEPVGYVFTRLEGVMEFVLFLGPWLTALLVLALRSDRSWASRGLVVLGLMLVAGAFKTGETARACLFVLPCVIALVAPHLTAVRTRVLVIASFAQATFMQLIGDFFW